MKKYSGIKKATVIGATGIIVFTWGITSVSASIVANEEPLAGINMTLDKFVVSEVEAGVVSSIVKSIIGNEAVNNVTDISTTALNAAVPDTTAVDGSATAPTDGSEADAAQGDGAADDEDMFNEEKPEHVKLNLNYERLGIADVDTYLNVRAKADTDSKIVGKLIKHAGCHIYKVKKGWAKIKSGNVIGYVKSEYLVMDEAAETMAVDVGTKVATVMTGGLRVRALPSTDASIYSALAQDEDFEICRENITEQWLENFISKHSNKKQVKKVNYEAMIADLPNWVCISVDNDYAFVSREFIEISYKLNRAVAIGEMATDGSDGVSSTRASLVEYAKKFLGNRYVYGGTSLTNGTDCSGFSMGVFGHFGFGLPRTSGSQASSTRTISGSDVKPGDLFFYGSGGHVSHVAIYIGSGMIIHASNPRSGIKISNAYYRSPIKIGRIISD